MHSLEVIIERNARVAGREARHALNDGDLARAQAIQAAQGEEIEGFCARDHADLVIDSPAADLSFLAFNRGRNAGRQEG